MDKDHVFDIGLSVVITALAMVLLFEMLINLGWIKTIRDEPQPSLPKRSIYPFFLFHFHLGLSLYG